MSLGIQQTCRMVYNSIQAIGSLQFSLGTMLVFCSSRLGGIATVKEIDSNVIRRLVFPSLFKLVPVQVRLGGGSQEEESVRM